MVTFVFVKCNTHIITVDCLDFVIDLRQPVLWSMVSCAGWTWRSVTLSWRRRFLCSACEGGTRRTVAYSSYPSRETETPMLLLVSPSNTLFDIVQIIMSPKLVLAFLDYLAVSPCCHSRFSLSNRFYKLFVWSGFLIEYASSWQEAYLSRWYIHILPKNIYNHDRTERLQIPCDSIQTQLYKVLTHGSFYSSRGR